MNFELDIVVYNINTTTWKAAAEGTLISKPTLLAEQVQRQRKFKFMLHNATLSQ